MANRFPLIFNSGAGQIQELAASDNLDLTSSNLVNAGILFTSSGSATAPSLQIGSGTTYNPGLYSPGTDQLAISTNGSGRLFVDASGNVRIASGSTWATADGNLQLSFNTNEAYATTYYDNHSITFGAGTSYKNKIRVSATGADNAITFHVGATSPNERMRITGAGLVGIGASSPSSLLHLSVATAASDGTKGVRITNPVGTAAMFECGSSNDSYVGTTSASHFSIRTNNTSRIYVTDGGNVGIGTTSPGYLLDVASSVAQVGNSTDAFIQYKSTAGNWHVGANTSNAYVFYSGTYGSGTERARIDSSGRLLVGTSSYDGNARAVVQGNTSSNTTGALVIRYNGTRPLSAGEGIGSIRFESTSQTNANYHYASISCDTDGASSSDTDIPGRLVFSTTADGASSPTERMRISNDGRTSAFSASSTNTLTLCSAAAAGTTFKFIEGAYGATGVNTGTESFRVYTNGNVENTNNSYGSISDIKLKENIVDANSQWDDIKALQVRNYNFKEGQTHTQIGLIAQEVELVSPGLVTESPDRDAEGNDLGTVTKSVNYSVLYMKAVKALQEAIERIETLEAKVAALESA